MIAAISDDVARRGISRLCHFTPSRGLGYILSGGVGILPSRMLREEERLFYNPTDLARLDGHTDHICCSIEYPNAWYLDIARGKEKLFLDWVVIFIHPAVLAAKSTLFCPRNAAANSGVGIAGGYAAYSSLFAPSVRGSGNRTYSRTFFRPDAVPTDEQAEVLIEGMIPIKDVLAIGVASQEQAQMELVRLRLLGIDVSNLKFVICPQLFNKYALSSALKNGPKPLEILWTA